VASITHLLDPVRGQPITQAEQAAHRGLKLRDVFLAAAVLVGDAHARGDLRLVDIQRRRALDDQLHLVSFLAEDMTPNRRPGALMTNESGGRARSTVRSSGETPHAKLKTGSRAPRQGGRRHGRRPESSLLFMRPRASAKRTWTLKAIAPRGRTDGPESDGAARLVSPF
jgi:hypothetical protein